MTLRVQHQFRQEATPDALCLHPSAPDCPWQGKLLITNRVAELAGGWDALRVPDDVRVSERLTIPAAELAWRFSRSSGPGGQGVNTTDSRVELSWDLAGSQLLSPALRERAIERLGSRLVQGVLTVTASEHRSQLRNREAAAARLAGIVAGAIAPPPRTRRATRPSRGAVERRIAEKKRRSQTKRNRRADND
jgi:ribosome-associated protein